MYKLRPHVGLGFSFSRGSFLRDLCVFNKMVDAVRGLESLAVGDRSCI